MKLFIFRAYVHVSVYDHAFLFFIFQFILCFILFYFSFCVEFFIGSDSQLPIDHKGESSKVAESTKNPSEMIEDKDNPSKTIAINSDVAEALLGSKEHKDQLNIDVKIGDGMDIAIHGENGKWIKRFENYIWISSDSAQQSAMTVQKIIWNSENETICIISVMAMHNNVEHG